MHARIFLVLSIIAAGTIACKKPASTPTQQKTALSRIYVVSSDVNFRAEPATSGKLLAKLNVPDELEILGKGSQTTINGIDSGFWYNARHVGTNTEGYIWSGFVADIRDEIDYDGDGQPEYGFAYSLGSMMNGNESAHYVVFKKDATKWKEILHHKVADMNASVKAMHSPPPGFEKLHPLLQIEYSERYSNNLVWYKYFPASKSFRRILQLTLSSGEGGESDSTELTYSDKDPQLKELCYRYVKKLHIMEKPPTVTGKGTRCYNEKAGSF